MQIDSEWIGCAANSIAAGAANDRTAGTRRSAIKSSSETATWIAMLVAWNQAGPPRCIRASA